MFVSATGWANKYYVTIQGYLNTKPAIVRSIFIVFIVLYINY